MMPIVAEVCVIGSGPAGAAISQRLKLLRHDVVLIDACSHRRRPTVESVSPGILHFLDMLNMPAALDTCAAVCHEPLVFWRDSAPSELPQSAPAGYLLDRARFDAALTQGARAAGVRLIEQRVDAMPERLSAGAWRVQVLTAQGAQEVHARLLIVATGRKTLLRSRRRRMAPPLMALQSRWLPARRAQPRISVEALRDGWVWGAPHPDGSYCAAAFMDPQHIRRPGRPGIDDVYLQFLSGSTLFKDLLGGARLEQVWACDASAYLADDVIQSDLMLVGDSAISMEPLSAQGVQVAMKLGCQGAAVVHTMLTDEGSSAVAQSFYRRQCQGIAARHQQALREFYSEPRRFECEPFWKKRAIRSSDRAPRNLQSSQIRESTRLRLSPNARLQETPCLVGDRIDLQLALEHPSLDGPMSHLGRMSIAALLHGAEKAQSAGSFCRGWAATGLAERPIQVLNWLIQHGILTQVDESDPCSRYSGKAGAPL